MGKEEAKKIIGSRIKEYRKAAGMTQKELAEKAGYTSNSTINKIELGKNDVPIEKIRTIAAVLNVDPALILGLGDDKKREITVEEKIRGQYGDGVLTLFELITRLDPEDRAEIRGMARLMLMDKKYTEKNIKRA